MSSLAMVCRFAHSCCCDHILESVSLVFASPVSCDRWAPLSHVCGRWAPLNSEWLLAGKVTGRVMRQEVLHVTMACPPQS